MDSKSPGLSLCQWFCLVCRGDWQGKNSTVHLGSRLLESSRQDSDRRVAWIREGTVQVEER